MANQALDIMKLKTLIRFKQEGRTHRFIGKSLGLSRTTVVKYVQFLEDSGLDWKAVYSTQTEHMPSTHRFVSEWSEAYFIRRAQGVGPHTVKLFEGMFRTKDHPEQAYRSCLGILALAQQHGHASTEQACFEAVERRQYNYAFIFHHLQQNRSKSSAVKVLSIPDAHQNLRGPDYYLNKNESDPNA